MIFVEQLSEEEVITLEDLKKFHPKYSPRTRAHSILLSHQGYPISEISSVLSICRQTVSTSISNWETNGIRGLLDKPRSGRPRIIEREREDTVVEKVNESPRKLKNVLSTIEEELNQKISLSTLKRVCKRAGLAWKRIRKSLKSKRDEKKFNQCKQEIEVLLEYSKMGCCDLFYFDESGFDLEPSIPYAWQPKGETIEVPSSKSTRLNVLGFINHQCKFDSFVVEGSVNTDVVIACIDNFASKITKETYLVIDNASMHTSKKFKDKISEWKKKKLFIKYLSPYSPELNIIEIVWRKIKYEWIPFSSYNSFEMLKENLNNILSNTGKEYVITFH